MKRSYLFGLAAAALFGGVYIQGCGGGLGSADGGGCADDSECLTGQVCDTSTNTCLTSCTPGTTGTAAAECTGSETACQAFHNLTGTVCVCTSNADCLNGGTCDTAKGTCSSATTGGSSGSTGSGSCGSGCQADQHCETSSNTCQAGAPCDSSEVELQGANCQYGEACFQHAAGADFWCDATASEQCPNSVSTNTTPNASPVVYDIIAGTTETAPTSCNTGTAQNFTGHFYDPNSDIAATTSFTAAKIHWVGSASCTSCGNQPGNGADNTYKDVSIDPSSGTFTFQLCTDLSGTATGVYLTNGSGDPSNVACLPSF